MADKNIRVERRKIADLQPDPANANQGTERGLRVLDDSVRNVGLGRSAVADKNGIILAGNKTQERAVDNGFEDAIIVHTTGNELVIVQRDDLDLTDPDDNRARMLAYYDNRAGQVGLEWNAAQIAADVEAGLDLSGMFTPVELEDIGALDPASDAGSNGSSAPVDIPEQFSVLVECVSETQQTTLLEFLTNEGYSCRALIS